MAFEMLVGLNVIDDRVYADYREAMAPILRRYGGGFRYDFKVAETLRSEAGHPINRVFTIHFEDERAKDGFFGDPEYKAVKTRFFEASVRDTAIIAQYPR